MNPNKDKFNGTVNSVVGKAKEASGDLLADPALKLDGQLQQIKGEGQQALGAAKAALREGMQKAGRLIEDAGHRVEHSGKKKLGDLIQKFGEQIADEVGIQVAQPLARKTFAA